MHFLRCPINKYSNIRRKSDNCPIALEHQDFEVFLIFSKGNSHCLIDSLCSFYRLWSIAKELLNPLQLTKFSSKFDCGACLFFSKKRLKKKKNSSEWKCGMWRYGTKMRAKVTGHERYARMDNSYGCAWTLYKVPLLVHLYTFPKGNNAHAHTYKHTQISYDILVHWHSVVYSKKKNICI